MYPYPQQLEMPLDNCKENKLPAKRVDIVSLKIVRESSFLYPERIIRSPLDAVKLLQSFLQDADREYFIVVCLDTKNQVNSITTSHIGTLNASIVHPRECFKTALLSNAATILIAHNHPSGSATPSPEDIAITKRLCKAGEILGIELLDHIIIADTDYCSLKEKNYI